MAVDAARAKSLFLVAADLSDPVERADYLERECGGDAELRGRVEALLQANDAAPLPLASTKDATSAHASAPLPSTETCFDPTACVGSVVADKYKLIQEIGEGGMGSVYMAQQSQPVRRAVAVKVIKAALLEVLRIVREVEAPRPSAKLSTIDTLPSIAANRGTEPARLSKLMKGELDWLVLKALEKDRSRRYESASGLARDIERYLADELVEARPPSAGYRLKKFLRRHKGQMLAAAAAAVALLSITATVVVGGFYAEARQARLTAERLKELAVAAETSAQKENVVAQKAAIESQQSKERVRQVFYAADIQLARTHWEANRPVKMRDLLEQHIPAVGDQDLRGFEWHYLWRLANSSQRTLRGHAQPIDTLAFTGSTGALLSGDVEYQYRTAGTLRKWPGGRVDDATILFTQLESPSRPATILAFANWPYHRTGRDVRWSTTSSYAC